MNLWKAEDFWASVHCTSTLLDKIASKRKTARKNEQYILQKSEGLLSVAYSKKENIDGFISLIRMKHFKVMAEIMMLDIYKYRFDEYSSVNGNSTMVLNERLEKLKSISLKQHTFGVVNELYKLITMRYGIYSDVFYIAALAHDFGKCDALVQDYNMDSSLEHHKASAEYVKKIALKAGEKVVINNHDNSLINTIFDVLNAHHTEDDAKMFHAMKTGEENKTLHIEVINKLKEADQNQRDVELEMVS